MTVVIDASALVAALVDSGPVGGWAQELLGAEHLAAPHLLPVETANVLRRAASSGELSDDVATLAHADLTDLTVDLYDYEPFAERIWQLRHNLSSYDAWYVALGEALGAPLATLDRRLVESIGPTCAFIGPPD